MAYEQKRLPMTAEIVRSNRRGGPEGVIDAVEQLAPDGFTDIEKVLSHAQREAIVRGYASKAGFAPPPLGLAAVRGSEVVVLRRPRSGRLEGWPPGEIAGFMVRDGAEDAPPHHEDRSHAPGGGGRKWMLCSAASATTASGVCSFMLWIAQNRS